VVVAWNGTAASNRALHGALPLLRAAKAVTLLQPPRGDRRTADGQVDALPHLRAHGVSVVDVATVDGADEAASGQLLAHVADQRADLLVMGASGRHRLGERWLGPTTRGVLSQSRVPVFLRQ